MIKHCKDVVKKIAVEHLNPGKTPVNIFDQRLFALTKQIQVDYGEDKFVVMFGGLKIEMATLKSRADSSKRSNEWPRSISSLH